MRSQQQQKQSRRILGLFVRMALSVVLLQCSYGQTFRNNGTLNITTDQSYVNFQNFQGSAVGTVNNQATMTVSGTMNNNKAGSVINNQIGGTGGVISLTDVAGDYNNGAGATNNSNTTSKISIGNTLTLGAGAFTTTVGEVEFAKAGTQTIPSGVASATYGKLTLAGSNTKTLGGAIIVADQVTLGAGTTFDIAALTLTLNGATPFTGSGTFTASTVGATVVYNASVAQSVYSTTYSNLTIQNSNTKTALGSITVNAVLTNSTTFDLSTQGLTTGASSTITNTGGTIQTAGTVTFGATHTIAGTFIYQANAGSQTIAPATYAILSLANNAEKVVATGTTVRTNSSLSIPVGTVLNVQNTAILTVDIDLTVNGTLTNNGTVNLGN